MSQVKRLVDVLNDLPQGPWTAFGHTVYAGPAVVASCSGPDAHRTAAALARLPDIVKILSSAYPDEMAARIADLEEALTAIHKRCECC